MASYTPDKIRNVILLSHSGAGKTTLAEALLYSCGTISRMGRVEEGNTASDYDPDELKRRISLNLSLLPCPWKEARINLLDTPGYTDFMGEVIAGLQVAEAAIIVVCAASGVQVGTEQVWRYAEEARLPRLIVINRMDRENADFFKTVQAIQNQFGQRCLPLQAPMGAQQAFQGVTDLLSGKAFGPEGREISSPGLSPEAQKWREKLVEAAVESDDVLLARYLEGEELKAEELHQALVAGVRQKQVFPILATSALKNIGSSPLLDAIRAYLPSPQDVSSRQASSPGGEQTKLEANPTGPLAVQVFKTAADPYVGKLTYMRVFSGTLQSNSPVWNANKNTIERIGQLYSLRGKAQEPISQLIAGDIGAVAKLSVTGTGDTLCTKEQPRVLPGIKFPTPILSLAVNPKTKADLDKMGTALARQVEEDPTLLLRKEPETGEIVLVGLGETHLEVTAERMHRKFGVDVKLTSPKIPYRETITAKVQADYRHKKQTGGHGQFAHVFMELEPLPRGSGLEFVDKIVGGAISHNYISAVEKGFREAAQEGVLGGYPVDDIRAKLYDGKEHPVDSSDICFKIAAAGALKNGLTEGKPVLLEPIMKIRVTVQESYTGEIIGDLNTKRAKVLGMTPQDHLNVIEALAPLTEVQRYAVDLRSKTQGRGSFTMEFSHYEEVPAHVTQKIIAERASERKS